MDGRRAMSPANGARTCDTRDELAEFVRRHEDLIRARFRSSLEDDPSSLFDSSDFFATVLRRVDAVAGARWEETGRAAPASLILHRILLDAIAEYARSRAADRDLAALRESAPAFSAEPTPDDSPSLPASVLEGLAPVDQQIARLRVNGLRHEAIGCALGLSTAATRMRWHRIAAFLRPRLAVGRV